MNFLIYDEQDSLSVLVRSVISGAGHAASLSTDTSDALLKLRTALFDAVVIGPGGAPAKLARHLDEEMPHLPILLLGVDGEIPQMDRIHAALPSPVNLGALAAAARRLENASGMTAPSGMPVSISFDGLQVLCEAERVTRGGMIVRHQGLTEDFHSFFRSAGGQRLTATFSDNADGAGPIAFHGSVKYVERGPGNRVRVAGIVFDGVEEEAWDSFCRRFAARPEGASSRERRPARRLRRSG